MNEYNEQEMEDKKEYDISSKKDMAYLRDQYAEGNVKFQEDDVMQEQTGNAGWQSIAEKVDAEYDLNFFEEQFNSWQKQAILLTEITYAKTYTFVTPLGVFTHIGTLARALQYIFEKDWEIHACLTGSELTFLVKKGIADTSHSIVCKFVELDQAFSDMHMDGWKFNNSFEFAIPRKALVPMANCLLDMATDGELEGCNKRVTGIKDPAGEDVWYVRVEEKGENKMVLSMPTGKSLFGPPKVDADEE